MAETHDVPPVLFIVFNRRDTAMQVLAGIREARPSRLYVAADGPRPSRPAERATVQEVRDAVLGGVDWPCEVKTLFQEENLGCRNGVKTAIDWFFREEESGIILEDDVIPAPEFFPFCAEALERYRDNPEIFMISGTNPLGMAESSRYLYSSFGGIWGWASWRRAWEKYDVEMTGWPSKDLLRPVRAKHGRMAAAYLAGIFNGHRKFNIDTWDTQWTFALIKNQALAVVPETNLIRNIGIVGTHSSVEMKNHNLPYGQLHFPASPRSSRIEDDRVFGARLVRETFMPALMISTASRWAKKLGLHELGKTIYTATRKNRQKP